jgi:hypothetical protein
MELEGSIPNSQELSTCPYPEPNIFVSNCKVSGEHAVSQMFEALYYNPKGRVFETR